MNFWMSEIDKSKYKDKYNVKYKDKDTNKGLASYYDYPLLSEKYPNIRLSLNIGYSVEGGAAVSVKGWGQCLTVTLSTQTFLNFYQSFDKHKDKKDNQMKMKKTKRMANASLLHFPLKPSSILLYFLTNTKTKKTIK